ncbi:transcription antitermination factor NusB [Caproiciproducens sp. CPB-2]|uniref:transcription antitermination factor NusB n=1 Tax=unclassified Caproiciproducens TaxID=2643836 RepID=UPI0023DA4F8F|nr:transcription antitermination factor NusB [Caproiciproducens sp. CPB-2]MDF1496212.1 transcription antitermination factor NusB [Caproiciproducens sp. CPB-2]
MKRHEAREQAFALIFERSINHDPTEQIIDAAGLSRDIIVDDFAERVAVGVEENEDALNARIEKNIRGWKMNRLSKVALALMKLSIYEMMFEKDIPVSVSINEAVDLAKKYGGADDAPFVNGVLGSVAKELGEKESHERAD